MRPILTAAVLLAALPAAAADLRFATTSDPNTLDPNAGNSAPVFSLLNNVYEGLVRRGRDMTLEPALATAWEPIGDGEGWRTSPAAVYTSQHWLALSGKHQKLALC